MAQDIINNFHSLITHTKLGKVFQTMNILMNSYDKEIKGNLTSVIATYKPTNDLEKLFRIKLIDRYRCYDEVLSILKGEDTFYISHVLRSSWFFENFIFDPQHFVNNVLPYMSYSTRCKVLRKYSKLLKNSDVAGKLFNFLKQRYGLNMALILLPACHEDFVKHILETISIKVPISVLLPLFTVYPSVVIGYLSHLLDCNSKNKRVFRTFRLYNFEKIFTLVALKKPKEFIILMEKYHHTIPYMKLGKRSTKQFVCVAFDSIRKNVEIYKRILHWRFVVPCLSLEQISELQLALLPKTVNEFLNTFSEYCDFVDITSSLKLPIRREILFSNFLRAYNRQLTDYLDVIDIQLGAMLPIEVKEKWIESKLPKLDSPNKKALYITYLPAKKSFAMLKKIIEEQVDPKVRSQVVNCMFQSAEINNDNELISDVCHYIVKRLRNDRNIIRENVIIKLSEYKGLIHVSDDCWQSIEEIINIMLLNNELVECRNQVIQILSTQIHSRLKRNLPIDSYLGKLLQVSSNCYSFELCKNTLYEKQCLKWFVDNFQENELKNEKKRTTYEAECYAMPETLFKRLCQWNAYHKNDRIDAPDWLKTLIEKLLISDNCQIYQKNSVLQAIKRDELIKQEMYYKLFPNYINPSILTYVLYQNPEVIKDCAIGIMTKILSQFADSYQSFFKRASLYPTLYLTDIISEHCISILMKRYERIDELDYNARKMSVRILSIILPTYKFIEIIANFYPQKSVIDDYTIEGREIFQIQSEISACLKYVNSPSEILDTLSKFAVGDYLKLVAGSLNSICLRTPEYKILTLLKKWLDCPISLRKHFLRAYFSIAPISNTLEMLVNLFENEKNLSLRMLLFNHARRFFLSEPSSESFSVLKAVILKLQSSDHDAINELFNIEYVPDEFISEYIQLLWNIVCLKDESLLTTYRGKVIDLIEAKIVVLIDEEFCDDVITEVFAQNVSETKIFAVRYLLYSEDLEQLNRRIKNIMPRLELLVKQWNVFDLKSSVVFDSRNTISFFVNALAHESFKIDIKALHPYEIIKEFKTSLLNILQENDIFEELLTLDLSTFFHIRPDSSESMYYLSEFLKPVVSKMVHSYGVTVIDVMYSVIKKILMWKFSQDENILKAKQIQLTENLLNSSSNNCFILGIKILPTIISSDIDKYKDLVTIILQDSDPVVKLYANQMLKELRSSVNVQ